MFILNVLYNKKNTGTLKKIYYLFNLNLFHIVHIYKIHYQIIANFLNHLGQGGVNKNLMISFNKGGVFTFWRKYLLN